jgi:hypothetical protein
LQKHRDEFFKAGTCRFRDLITLSASANVIARRKRCISAVLA